MIEVHSPIGDKPPQCCSGCGGAKEAPIAAIAAIYHHSIGVTIALCEVCGRDAANAIGFMCVRDGGWSKLEPRKRKTTQNDERNANNEAAHTALHGKILGFLKTEWERTNNRRIVGVDLVFSPGTGFREEPIRKWVRADEPEFFAEIVNIEKLVTRIIKAAEGKTATKPAGKYRFFVRTHQHLGGRAHLSFALSQTQGVGG